MEPKWKQEGTDFSGPSVGRGDRPYTSFYGPRRSRNLPCSHIWSHLAQPWCPDQGRYVTPGVESGEVRVTLVSVDR